MVSGERRQADNALLRSSISELQAVAIDYTDLMLMDIPVRVDMAEITGGFTMPPKTAEAFTVRGVRPPQAVDSMSMDMRYDRMDQQFSLTSGLIAFDNGHVVGLSDPHQIPGEVEPHYYLDLFSYNRNAKVQMDRVGLTPVSDGQGLFHQCGVTLPMAPHRADWDDVLPMLSSAQLGIITAKKKTPITIEHELIVTKQTTESLPVVEDDDLTMKSTSGWLRRSSRNKPFYRKSMPDCEAIPAWTQELSIQLVDRSKVDNQAIEAVLRSSSPFEEPTFCGLYLHDTPREIANPLRARHYTKPQPELPSHEGKLLPVSPLLTQYIIYLTRALEADGLGF